MEIIKKILYPLAILSVIVLSFFSFTPYFSKTLNSDLAVHILMAENLHLPSDFYYWGQDRLGSIIPILANLFYTLFPIKGITAITIVQFALLLSIFYCLQRLVHNPISKFIMSLVVFIPFPVMLEYIYIGHPYLAQFGAISLVIFLHEIVLQKNNLRPLNKIFIYFLISLAIAISLWASEVSVIFVFGFIIYSCFSSIGKVSTEKDGFTFKLKINFKSTIIYAVVFLITLYFGFKFILYAKSFCYRDPRMENIFTDYQTFKNMLDVFWLGFRDSVFFKIDNIFLSVHNLVMVIIVLSLTFFTLHNAVKFKKSPPSLSVFFLLLAVFSFFFLMGSYWVAFNTYGYRYFTFPYLFFVLSIITYIDTLELIPRRILQCIYIIGLIFSSILTFKHIKSYYKLDERNFSLNRASRLTPLANSGVIAEYWYSYILAINSDMNIKATPYETQYVRSSHMLDSALTRKDIYLVKNRWFDNFPDSLKQFGLYLIKDGKPQSISKVYFCKYKLADVHTVYYPKNGDERKGTLVLEKSSIKYATDSLKQYYDEFIIYGPCTKLPPGKYKVSFDLSYSPSFAQNGKITFDICEEWGAKVFGLQIKEFKNETIRTGRLVTEIIFEITQIKNIVEYRMKINGKFSLSINEVKVDRIY